MAFQKVKCIYCVGEHVTKAGRQASKIQRFKCKECKKAFQESYTNSGAKLQIKLLIFKMSLNYLDFGLQLF
ncbi:MAG: hypothetical protein FWG82_06185 [Oscillospiraceae bacterium]|nr:hypothetical protein [Oscillospiraceae bacterium]